MSQFSTFFFAVRWLGRSVGGLSVFNLAHGLFHFGLADFFVRLLKVYNQFLALLTPIVAFLRWLAEQVDVHLPVRLHDFVVLYAVFGLANLRTSNMGSLMTVVAKPAANPFHRAAMVGNIGASILLWPFNLFLRPLVWFWDYVEVRYIIGGGVRFVDTVVHGARIWRKALLQFGIETCLILAALAAYLLVNLGGVYAEALMAG